MLCFLTVVSCSLQYVLNLPASIWSEATTTTITTTTTTTSDGGGTGKAGLAWWPQPPHSAPHLHPPPLRLEAHAPLQQQPNLWLEPPGHPQQQQQQHQGPPPPQGQDQQHQQNQKGQPLPPLPGQQDQPLPPIPGQPGQPLPLIPGQPGLPLPLPPDQHQQQQPQQQGQPLPPPPPPLPGQQQQQLRGAEEEERKKVEAILQSLKTMKKEVLNNAGSIAAACQFLNAEDFALCHNTTLALLDGQDKLMYKKMYDSCRKKKSRRHKYLL